MKGDFMLGGIVCVVAKRRGKGAESGIGRGPWVRAPPAEASSPLSKCSSGLTLGVLTEVCCPYKHLFIHCP